MKSNNKNNDNCGLNIFLRLLPAMDRLLSLPWVADMENIFGKRTVKRAFTEIVAEYRKAYLEDGEIKADKKIENTKENLLQEIGSLAHARLLSHAAPSLARVINATGVVVHTNLGRSCLAPSAVQAVCSVAANYSTLEYDLKSGARGHRNAHVEWLVCQATGADAALVVNNNAAAVILALSGLVKDKEVIISRGELVEIGGSFRIPDIMAFSGANMIEVGTTNRTHIADYVDAVTPQTGALLKVHPSNYRIEGFTHSTTREELAALAKERDILLIEDMGSGLLMPLAHIGEEPTVSDCLAQGVDIVTFSGDKLLGGPQIGVIAGERQVIDKLRKNPLLRAFRVDKMTLAAFEETLRLFLSGKASEIPTYAMLNISKEDLKAKAENLAMRIKDAISSLNMQNSDIAVVEALDAVGGGAFPAVTLEGFAVSLKIPRLGSAGRVQELFRKSTPPVIVGAKDNLACIHVRTLLQGDEDEIINALVKLSGGHKG